MADNLHTRLARQKTVLEMLHEQIKRTNAEIDIERQAYAEQEFSDPDSARLGAARVDGLLNHLGLLVRAHGEAAAGGDIGNA